MNFDGLLVFSKADTPASISTYVQIYRNGIIEVALDSIGDETNGTVNLSTEFYERNLLSNLALYLEGFRTLSIRTPIWALLTLTGVKGALIRPRQHIFSTLHPIDRDDLSLPEIVIEDLNQPPAELFRPAFDLIWNAAGLPRSFNFDEQGRFCLR